MNSTPFKVLKPFRTGFWPKHQDSSFRLHLFCGKFRSLEKSLRLFSDSTNIVRSTFPKIELPNVPLHEFVFERSSECPDKIALECVVTGKVLKYKDILRNTKNVASALQKKFNLKKGDAQAIVLPNCADYPCIFLAGSMAGVVSTTINPLYTPTEISHQLDLVKPKVIFTVPEVYEKCLEAQKIVKHTGPIVVLKLFKDSQIPQGAVSYTELTDTPGDVEPVEFHPTDDIVIPFSSGTSGLPKGVQLTHRNLTANLFQFQSDSRLKEKPNKDTNQSIILGVLPMFHIYGMVAVTLDGLRCLTRLVIMPKFDPTQFVRAIYEKKIQILYLAPPLVSFLANHEAVKNKYLKHVQFVVNGAAPCPVTDIERLKIKSPEMDFVQGYGMTETSPVIAMTHYHRYHKVSSVGHPLTETFIKVADLDTGKALPKGSLGEICVKGPQVMKGYYKNPEETKKVFDEDGWLKTGDIGYYDEEFDFFIVDRMKELIKVKGFQVAPAELEDILKSHPAVDDVGVIGVSHPNQGEAPRAYIVLKNGVSATEAEIQDFIKNKLSPYKHLKGGVRFVRTIPKSSSGKILRRDLKKLDDEESS